MGQPARTSTATEVLGGLVERVTFHNEENGFCVLRVKARGQRDLITVLGHAAAISAGKFVQASGAWQNDRTHGVQFRASFLKATPPTTTEGIEKYLGSGMAMAPILIYPNAIIGLSDGGPHVQFQSGFGFSTRLLAEFDPDTVRPLPLEVVHDFPTGAKHIKEAVEGRIATVVNGEVVMEGDKHTGTLPPPRVKQHLRPRGPRLIAEA